MGRDGSSAVVQRWLRYKTSLCCPSMRTFRVGGEAEEMQGVCLQVWGPRRCKWGLPGLQKCGRFSVSVLCSCQNHMVLGLMSAGSSEHKFQLDVGLHTERL